MPRNLLSEARREVTWAVIVGGGVRVRVGIELWVWLVGEVMVVEEQRRLESSVELVGMLLATLMGEIGEVHTGSMGDIEEGLSRRR